MTQFAESFADLAVERGAVGGEVTRLKLNERQNRFTEGNEENEVGWDGR